MDIKSLRCFEEVARVIGEESAELELGKVSCLMDHSSIAFAFIWEDSPQGNSFWKKISHGDYPYGQPNTPDSTKTLPPSFGDILRCVEEPCTVLNTNGDNFLIAFSDGSSDWSHKSALDEYKNTQEEDILTQVLADWKSQSLDHAFDAPSDKVTLYVKDIANFIIDNGYKKEST